MLAEGRRFVKLRALEVLPRMLPKDATAARCNLDLLSDRRIARADVASPESNPVPPPDSGFSNEMENLLKLRPGNLGEER